MEQVAFKQSWIGESFGLESESWIEEGLGLERQAWTCKENLGLKRVLDWRLRLKGEGLLRDLDWKSRC